MEIQLAIPLLIVLIVLNTVENGSKVARLLPLYLQLHQQMESNAYGKVLNEPELRTSAAWTPQSQLVCTAGLPREYSPEEIILVKEWCGHYLGRMQSLSNSLPWKVRRKLQMPRPSF
jgi:hypothetical protein